MSKARFTVGPVLSFRGVSETGQWQVTALVGVAQGSAFPALVIEGRACAAPKVLLEHGKETILRYDLSCEQQAQERTVQFGAAQGGPQCAGAARALCHPGTVWFSDLITTSRTLHRRCCRACC